MEVSSSNEAPVGVKMPRTAGTAHQHTHTGFVLVVFMDLTGL